MDGKRREISVRLIAASIPLQALMMAGVATLALGAASHAQPAPTVQVSPAQSAQPAYLVPGQTWTCWTIGWVTKVPPGDRQGQQGTTTCMLVQSGG